MRSGVYKEKITVPGNRTNIHIIGEDVDKVVFTYDDYASKKNEFGDNIGTSGSAPWDKPSPSLWPATNRSSRTAR